ncbi:hypothetical protein RB594_003554 [Gaeumannomyces avenae]
MDQAAPKNRLPPPGACEDPADELAALSLRDVLDADSRPTFVLDLDPDEDLPAAPGPEPAKPVIPVFCNAALRQHERLFDALVGPDATGLPEHAVADGSLTPPATYNDFRRWATGVTPHDDSKDVFPLSFLYAGLLWTGSTVRQRWRLISGSRLWRADSDVLGLSAAASRNHSPTHSCHNAATAPPVPRPAGPQQPPPPPPPPSPPSDKLAYLPPDKAPTLSDSATATPRATNSTLPALPDRPPTATSSTLVSSTKFQPKPCFGGTPDGSSNDTGSTSLGPRSITLSSPEKAVSDWTMPNPRGVLSEHQKFARSIDWAATPLGAMESWSPEFRQAANLCLSNPFPAALFWGGELTVLYNEAYAVEVAGSKHPSLMGTGFSGPFAEIWDYAGPIFAECARTGISVRKENDGLTLHRDGYLLETFYSWAFVPLYGGTNRILGFYNAPFSTTETVLNQRWLQTINRLGSHTAHAKSVKQFWRLVLEALEDNVYDVPFALLYSLGDIEDPENSSTSSGSTLSLKSCHLEGSIAVPGNHPASPQQLDLKRSREGFVPSFREAMRTREPTLLHTRDGSLPEAMLEGIAWRGFGDPCREAIIFPVRPTNGDVVLAFLVLGANPRRPYDEPYKAFIATLNRQLATSLASVILFEDEVRRSRNAAETAALEREQLTEQLTLQASRLRRMTELSPLGMFLISPDGVLREANDRFFEMTEHPRESQYEYEMSWMDFILESSVDTMESGWRRLVQSQVPWSGELQLKKRSPAQSPVNLHGESIDYWVLLNAHPEFASDGTLRSIMGSITDISHLKWAQGLQHRQLQEAEETRRQQNEFIDITSVSSHHEMRNPLSAILQCADDISSALSEAGAEGPPPADVVDSCVEAAHTIALCVQHQKSIVDDILTISKLDSNLLLITPVPTQPLTILRRAVKMFDPELQAKQIQVQVETNPLFHELAVDWVTLDPSRVLQVLINLMTNAIKFTAPVSGKRLITVGVGASLAPPDASQIRAGFQYVPSKTSNLDITAAEEWGAGEVLYVNFQVQDTGCGLSEAEKQMLFQRFKQASPRTHAQYGGSGLGLFISKRLAELHGGQIGVASEAGEGSLFGFFVQGKRLLRRPSQLGPSLVGESPSLLTGQEQERRDDEQQRHPIEHHLGADPSSLQSLHMTPQRQDFASIGGPVASLVATKASATVAVAVAAVGNRLVARASTMRSAAVATVGVPAKDMHILVVEDNLINQKVLVTQLRKAGCTVHTANDGIEALAFLDTTSFRVWTADEQEPSGGEGQRPHLSIILMDLEMPNMDGLTCVSEIRKMEADGRIARHVPVIAVTANVRDEQVAKARSSGMDDVVSKPFRIPELLAKVNKLLTA